MNKNNSGELFICGGCNAKIGPGNLEKLLKNIPRSFSEDLLVGFDTADDAAVIKLNEEQAIIQTLDFFPTMVSDPYLFGKIAAANALSDVYAMGGDVLSAMNIVCFPEEKDLSILGEILRGGAEKVQEAGGMLVGGHSIHDSLPKYGLSVTGTIHPDKILKNNGCQIGDDLILTKPIGVGIITTAYSVGEASEESFEQAVNAMQTLNKYAAEIIRKYPVNSCTDITGFGLIGHLLETLGDTYSAKLYTQDIPFVEGAYECAKEFLITAGGQRNRNQFEPQVSFAMDDYGIEELLFDPQTSGGLLVSVPKKYSKELIEELSTLNLPIGKIGEVIGKEEKSIIIE